MCIRLTNDQVYIFVCLFVCLFNSFIQATTKKIIRQIEDCQKEIEMNAKELRRAMVKIETLHITLFALYLKDKHQLDM